MKQWTCLCSNHYLALFILVLETFFFYVVYHLNVFIIFLEDGYLEEDMLLGEKRSKDTDIIDEQALTVNDLTVLVIKYQNRFINY